MFNFSFKVDHFIEMFITVKSPGKPESKHSLLFLYVNVCHLFDGFEPHCATLCVSHYIHTVNASLLVLYMSNNYTYRRVKGADRLF